MKVGLWFYGLGTALTGILNIAFGAFDASHQPIQVLSKNPDQHLLAWIAGLWLVAAGLALLWKPSVRAGAVASAAAYAVFAALWLLRCAAGVHALGWHIAIVAGVAFGFAQQIMLLAPAVLAYASASPGSRLEAGSAIAARWMLGVPPVLFGLFHLMGIRIFATIVPHWMSFGYFWAGLTGIAFIAAGIAICSGIKDVLAARLLALMLLLFEFFVEIPPIFIRVHSQPTWAAAVYNISAIGACWIFAEFVTARAARRSIVPAPDAAPSRSNLAVA